MAREEDSCYSLHIQLIDTLSRTGVVFTTILCFLPPFRYKVLANDSNESLFSIAECS